MMRRQSAAAASIVVARTTLPLLHIVEPGDCATLSSGGNSIFLSFSFFSSAAIVACGSLSHRLKVATSAAVMPSCTGYRLEYDLANALQYLISEGVPLATFCWA